MVEVVNISNVRDFGSRPGDLYIGRKYGKYKQSVWANPFPITGDGGASVNGIIQKFTRESSIQRYIQYITNHEVVNVNGIKYNAQLAHNNISELLQAKRLGCWCKPHICHGDFLKKLIDKYNQNQPLPIIGKGHEIEHHKQKYPLKEVIDGFRIEYSNHISRSDVQRTKLYNETTKSYGEPIKIFVFGDNDQRSGFGGQAKEMRGEPNTIGVRVKKAPSMDNGSFYTDEEYESNVRKIAEDLEHLYKVAYGKTIVFPTNGVGTGMAMLNRTAPRTFAYLTLALKQMFNINNGNPQLYTDIYKSIDKEPSQISKFLSTIRSSKEQLSERRKKSIKTKLSRKPIKKPIKKIKRCICKK